MLAVRVESHADGVLFHGGLEPRHWRRQHRVAIAVDTPAEGLLIEQEFLGRLHRVRNRALGLSHRER